MTRKFHWTLILLAVTSILFFILTLRALSGLDIHFIVALTVILLSTFLFIYWLVHGLYKRQWGFVFKVLLTPLIILSIHYSIYYGRIQVDGWRLEIFTFLIGEDSNYPLGFSHRGFAKIRVGMTKAEVKQLVGEPFYIFPWDDKHNYNKVGFQYSKREYDTHFRVKNILFQGDTVVKVISNFYYD